MTEPGRRSPVAGALVVAAVLAVVGGGLGAATAFPAPVPPAARTSDAAAVAAEVPLSAVTLVCPEIRQGVRGLGTRVSLATLPGLRTGRVAAAPRGRSGTPLLRESGSAVREVRTDLRRDAVVVKADGGLAAGLEAEQVTRGESGSDRGYAMTRCSAPTAETWYVGATAEPGAATSLVLTNPARSAALVDLVLLGPHGQLDPPGGRGIVVPAGGRQTVGLDAMLAGLGPAAVGVVARGGRIASAVRVVRVDGTDSAGVDWLAPQDAAAEELLIPAVPGLLDGAGRRTLQLANPSSLAATATVTLIGPSGAGDPQSMPVPARSTVTRDLDVGTDPVAVRVTATRGAALLGAVDAVDGDDGSLRDFGTIGPAAPVDGSALVSDVVLAPGITSTLVLTTAAAAQLVLRALPVAGEEPRGISPRRLSLAAGVTVAVPLSSLVGARGRQPVQLVVASGGPVTAGLVLRESGGPGPMLTLLSVQTPPARVRGLPVTYRPGLLPRS